MREPERQVAGLRDLSNRGFASAGSLVIS